MKAELKRMARPYLVLYAGALILAVIGYVSLTVMGRLGILEYSYRVAASPNALDGTLFDKLCVVLTGSTFVGFLFVAGLVLSLATAAVLLYAHLAQRPDAARGWQVGTELTWGFATAVVSVACAGVAAIGLFSSVQINLVSSSGGGGMGGGMGLIVVALLVAVGTLIAAACAVARACVAGVRGTKKVGRRLLAWMTCCAAVVAVLTAGTFGARNVQPANDGVIVVWLLVDCVANVGMLWLAERSVQGAGAKWSGAKG